MINRSAFGLGSKEVDLEEIKRKLSDEQSVSTEDLVLLAKSIRRELAQGGSPLDSDEQGADFGPGPRTPDELYAYVVATYGINISRTRICPDHDTPWDFFCDIVLARHRNVFGVGPRSGGKSFLVALAIHIVMRFNAECEAASFGAVTHQAQRVYAAFKSFLNRGLPDGGVETAGEPRQSRTYLINKAFLEIFTATVENVNGPHPQISHSDEVEVMRAAAWKEAQPKDTLIPTPRGKRRLGDLKYGDFVYGRDGKPAMVKKIFDYPETLVYEITFTDGRKTECCADHLWVVAGGSQMHRGIWKTMRFADMLAAGPFKMSSAYRFGIPAGEAIEMATVEQPLDPYVLGVLLGDGHMRTTSFRASEPHIVERVRERAGHPVVSWMDDSTGHEIHRINGIRPILRSLGLYEKKSKTKFVPEVYKLADREQRLEILRGLFDTDGCAIEGDSTIQYSTTSQQLARDVQEIVLSLGGRAILRSKRAKSNWGDVDLFTLDVSLGDSSVALTLPRKRDRLVPRRRTLNPYMKSVKVSRVTPVRCIAVDNEDETYRTNDYIVTHNSRQMAADKVASDGHRIPGRNVGTSTIKYKKGRVMGIVNDYYAAIKANRVPQWKLRRWCWREVTQNQPNCQMAQENRDRPRDELCQCHLFVSDKWPDGRDRVFTEVCKGDLYRAGGHRSLEEIRDVTFMQVERRDWNAQQECRETESAGLYLANFSRSFHGITDFRYDPANGPVYVGIDWGGSAASAVIYVQYLLREVQVQRWAEPGFVTLPAGARVAFMEIYRSDLTDRELGQHAQARQNERAAVEGRASMPIKKRWADVAGTNGIKEWKSLGMECSKYKSRDFDTQVKYFSKLVTDGKWYVDVEACPVWCDEAESWRKDDSGNEVKTFNHIMAASRYLVQGMSEDERRGLLPSIGGEDEADEEEAVNDDAPAVFEEEAPAAVESDDWRAAMGIAV